MGFADHRSARRALRETGSLSRNDRGLLSEPAEDRAERTSSARGLGSLGIGSAGSRGRRIMLQEPLELSGGHMNNTGSAMTKGEREDLIKLIKQREKVAKTAAEQRSAAMLADFELQITTLHTFDNNDVWRASVESVQNAAKTAMESIMAECGKLGIPAEFQPRVSWSWLQRGENAFANRRAELRRL